MLKKLLYILTNDQRRKAAVLAGLLVAGTFMEMLGLGIMIPVLTLMLKADIGNQYPVLKPYLEAVGNPDQQTLIVWIMLILTIFFVIKTLFFILLTWKQSKFSADLAAEISERLFLGYLRVPYAFHLKRNSSQLLNNIQTEVAIFNSVSQAVITVVTEFSVSIGVIVMLLLVEPVGALIVFSFLIFSALFFHRLTKKKLLIWGEKRQYHAGYFNKHLMQGLNGVKDVKLLGRENYFLEQFAEHNNAYAGIYTRMLSLQQIPRLYLEFLGVLGLSLLVIVMVLQQKPLEHLLPVLGVFVAAAFRMMPSMNRVMGASQTIRYAQPVVKLLHEEFLMIDEQETKSASFQGEKIIFNKSIQLSNIDFTYESASRKALDKISINIKKNSMVGFIGQSGSGKSSLVDVILGLLEPTNGVINVDGENIYSNIRSWQNLIGYVPQTIYLTDDTLRNNIALGIPDDRIDKEAIDRAVKASQLDQFIKELPDGLETAVGERGVRLSGGQRQRIGIARALYHDPELLVLDEATSALDSATETSVMEAISALHGNKTILIIAHRLSTVKNCDHIYKLDKGKIIQEGTPAFILAN